MAEEQLKQETRMKQEGAVYCDGYTVHATNAVLPFTKSIIRHAPLQ
jgi:hypothetical protein